MSANLTAPQFTNEEAIGHLEASRWPHGVVCPHCGSENVHRMGGKTQAGYFLCNSCRDKFTARTGTVMERSHIPVHKWLLAIHLMSASKKGMSAHQLHRMLGITYKSAWFLAHRIREAMKDDTSSSGPLGGPGKIVEADETYIGKKDVQPKVTTTGRPFVKRGKSGPSGKRAIVGLVERGGKVRTFHVDRANADTVRDVLVRNASRESILHTDESRLYTITGTEFEAHHTVRHSAGEYVRGAVHTNTIENVFSVFKRGMKGVYQHCGEQHLQRYLDEFSFRYSNRSCLGINDKMRAELVLKGIEGKRLTYRRLDEAQLG